MYFKTSFIGQYGGRNSIFFKLSLFHHQKIFTNVMHMYWIVVWQSTVTRVEVLFERCIKYWQGNKWQVEILFWELGWILSCFALVFISKLLIRWYEFKTSYWLNTQVDRWKVWINSTWKECWCKKHTWLNIKHQPLLNCHDL